MKTKMKFICTLGAGLAACGGPLEDAALEEASQVEVGQTEQGLGEIVCASTNNMDRYHHNYCNVMNGSCYYFTPDDSYGDDYAQWSNETCPAFFKYTIGSKPPLSAYPVTTTFWATINTYDLPDNKALCEKTYLEMAAYSFQQSGNYYTLAGTSRKRGVWNGSYCTIGYAMVNEYMACNFLNQCELPASVVARGYVDDASWLNNHVRLLTGIYAN